jgi:uncharacterized protein (TIGR03643 family)
VKQILTEGLISSIIASAWADDVSFDKIKRDTGYTESEVIAIMRKNLKNKSFIIWRKRVYGRKTKHEKLTRMIDRELEQ